MERRRSGTDMTIDPAPRPRPARAAAFGGLLTAAVLIGVLIGNADRILAGAPRSGGAAPTTASAEPAPAPEEAILADIVVVQGDRERRYSSRQLPPDGRLVYRRFADARVRLGEIYPPEEIAAWIFRVVPEATDVRITLTENDGERVTHFDYARESFSPT